MKEVSRPGQESYFELLLSAILIGVTCMWLGSCFVIHDAYYVDRQVYYTQNPFSPNATGTDYISKAFRSVAFVSAQLPLNATDRSVMEDLHNQTNQTLINLKRAVTNAGGFMRNVLKVTVYLLDIEKEPEVAGIFSQYFEEASFPAATIIGVADLPIIEGKQALVSMEAFVALP